MSKAWGKGSTRDWRKRRALVLARDHYRCRLRIPGEWRTRTQDQVSCLGVADCVHHIHGKTSTCVGCTTDQLDHLISSCTPCNLRVGSPVVTNPSPKPRPMTKW
jgi:hypothetical protein